MKAVTIQRWIGLEYFAKYFSRNEELCIKNMGSNFLNLLSVTSKWKEHIFCLIISIKWSGVCIDESPIKNSNINLKKNNNSKYKANQEYWM